MYGEIKTILRAEHSQKSNRIVPFEAYGSDRCG